MKNVFKIFISDLKAIVTHFFAFVIVLAVLVIPALYAWVNIYANWDPYGSTGNVPIALASRDAGYTTADGVYFNRGREIVEEVSASTSIRWVVTETADEAIAGVERGEFYGALVMGEHLSRNMYDLTAALSDSEPSIVFYQNAKTNAIANKITATAASTVEYNIQVKYLSVLIAQMLEEAEELFDEGNVEETLDHLIEVVRELREHLGGYIELIANLRAGEGDAVGSLDEAGRRVGGIDLGDTIAKGQAVRNAVAGIRAQLLDRVDSADERVQSLIDRVTPLSPEELSNAMLAELEDQVRAAEAELEALRSEIPADSLLGSAVDSSLSAVLQRCQSLEQALHSFDAGGDRAQMKENILSSLHNIRYLVRNSLRPSLEHFFDTMIRDMDILIRIITGVNTTVRDVQPVLSSAKSTILALNVSLAQLQTALENVAASMDKLLEKLETVRDSDLIKELVELLNGDPEQFAEFFAQPVAVRSETVYPVENYGTAMTPFYSTLAIWVGCVVSGAVIKPEADPGKLRKPKPNQLFFGRFLIFFLLGQIQAAIIVAGDIYLLGCQCVHPGLFFLTGAVTSLVFNILIYSLTVTFGDIGKAIGVVIMIVQIAGSSGSYPIEILPPIFSKIYTFFPFPYAINAMRETLCGLYQYDLYKYLGELLVFGVFGLLIGLRLRRHFAGVNAFVEEEMEGTGVL